MNFAGAARAAFEAMMQGNYEYQSDYARKYYGQGKIEGKAEGKAEAVLDLLELRGIEVAAEVRARILSCTDTAQLKAWLQRAATAKSAAELI